MGIVAFDVFDHFNLINRIALGRVNHHHINAGLDEQLEPIAIGLAGRDGGTFIVISNGTISWLTHQQAAACTSPLMLAESRDSF